MISSCEAAQEALKGRQHCLAECVAFIIRVAREIHSKQKFPPQAVQNATHMALDILHRFLVNPAGEKGLDWYMVGLACFFISAKLNSTHFGGAE